MTDPTTPTPQAALIPGWPAMTIERLIVATGLLWGGALIALGASLMLHEGGIRAGMAGLAPLAAGEYLVMALVLNTWCPRAYGWVRRGGMALMACLCAASSLITLIWLIAL